MYRCVSDSFDDKVGSGGPRGECRTGGSPAEGKNK